MTDLAKPACPNCGNQLTSVDLNADTPPWLCKACSRGWWNAEIEAGELWDPDTRSWGSASKTRRVLAKCERERAGQAAP
jgi:hypothetical protein